MGAGERKAIVVGAGIAGPVCALVLRRAGWDVALLERHAGPDDAAGSFLTLCPNGLRALAAVGLRDAVLDIGFACSGLTFRNAADTAIARLDYLEPARRLGSPCLNVRRGALHRLLREAAAAEGVPVRFGAELTAITPGPRPVVHLAGGAGGAAGGAAGGGEALTADLVVGCDGLRSAVRRAILPKAPEPRFQGLVDCGAFAQTDLGGRWPVGEFQMVFGARRFYAFVPAPDGTVWWFANVPVPEARREAVRALDDAAWRDVLCDGGEDTLATLLAATPDPIGRWPTYDLADLPRWNVGPVGLLGDAAHGMLPHAGQGASLALEDVVTFGACLARHPDPADAFAALYAARARRASAVAAQARRNGSSKAASPFAAWMRDRMLPFFLRLGAKQTEALFAWTPEGDGIGA